MYNFSQLLEDYNIDYKPENSRGFISIQCPICCNDNKYHGGLHKNGYYVCWKCDNKNLWQIIKILTGEHWPFIHLKYKTELTTRDIYLLEHGEQKERPKQIELPIGSENLNERARKYLRERRFDPDILVELYKIKSTGLHGTYNFRIIFPIYFENKIVSYTGRDYTKQSSLRYMSCSEKDEIIPHKSIVYGYDNVPGDSVIVVEGIFDKLRLGENAVALFGTSYTKNQILLLASFSKVFVMFDSEDAAQQRASNLANELSGMNVDVEVIRLTGAKDPDSLSQSEADRLVKELIP